MDEAQRERLVKRGQTKLGQTMARNQKRHLTREEREERQAEYDRENGTDNGFSPWDLQPPPSEY